MRQVKQHQPYWRDQATVPDDPEKAQFHERHAHLADRVHDFVIQVAILGLTGLVLIQTLNLSGPFRTATNLVEALEGVPWRQVTAWSKTDASRLFPVTVMLMNQARAPGAQLLVDNQPVGTFTSTRLTVQVQPGQALTVDGGYTQGPLVFRVVGAAGLASGLLGVEVTTRGNRRPLGVVKRTD